MKGILFGFLLFLTTALSAQKVVYVSSNGSDFWTGSRTQPLQTVHKALEQSGVTEVRVAVGKYKISVYGKGEIIVPAGVTVRGGYLEKTPHEVQDVLAENRGVAEGQSVFQGDSTCRIFEVGGVLEQVTVTGGRAEGGNGGGVFVKKRWIGEKLYNLGKPGCRESTESRRSTDEERRLYGCFPVYLRSKRRCGRDCFLGKSTA